MTDKKISELPQRTTLLTTDEFTTLADGINYRSPISALTGTGGGGDFAPDWEGAEPWPVQERQEQQVYLLDFIPEIHPTSGNNLHEAIRNGTSVFEGKPDFYDCADALYAAIEAVTVPHLSPTNIVITNFVGGPEIIFPYGHVYFGRTIEINKNVTLAGRATTGARSTASSFLWFKAGITGFVLNYVGTLEGGRPDNVPGSAVRMQHLSLQSHSNGAHETDPDLRWDPYDQENHWKGHGIWMRSIASIEHCRVARFPNHGLYIMAAADTTNDSARGNDNLFFVSHCSFLTCGGDGIHVQGPDTNAGICMSCDMGSNFGSGIYDSSFLGNTHIGHHTDNNGRDGLCSYQLESGVSQSNRYWLIDEARGSGQARSWMPSRPTPLDSYCKNGGNLYRNTNPNAAVTAAAPATGPSGTGTGIVDGTARWDYWAPVGTQIPPAGHPESEEVWGWIQESTGTPTPEPNAVYPPFPYEYAPASPTPVLRTRWKRGHPLWFDSINAHNAALIGLYSEGGQAPACVAKCVSVISTNFGFYDGEVGLPNGLGSGGKHFSGLQFESRKDSDHKYTISINGTADEALGFKADNDSSTSGLQFIFNEPDRTWAWQHARVVGNTATRYTTGISTLMGGRTEPIPAGRAVFGSGLWVGATADTARQITNATAAPTTGAHAAGDIIFRSEVSNVGNVLGWRCIADGTPGTWQPIHVNQASQRVPDAALTLTPVQSPYATVFADPIIAGGRQVTLASTGAIAGLRYRITRTAASTGGLITVGYPGATIAWAPNQAYAFGTVRSNGGLNYTCISPVTGVSSGSDATPIPAWTANTVYALNNQRQHGGNVYKCIEAGISADNPAWAPSTAYTINVSQVTNDGGRIYRCTKTGTSAASGGPTGTLSLSPFINDGTTQWAFVHPAWLVRTAYIAGKIVSNDGGKLYRCTQSGISGNNYEWKPNLFYKVDAVVENDINKVYVCTDPGYSADPYPQWQADKNYIVGEGVVNADGRGYGDQLLKFIIPQSLLRYYVCTQAGRSAVYGPWKPNTAYALGAGVHHGNDMYECVVAGTSDVSGGPTGEGAGIVDGTVTWNYTRCAGPDGTGTDILDGTAKWKFQTEEGPTGTDADIFDGPKHTLPNSGIYLAGSGVHWSYAYPLWTATTPYSVGQLVHNAAGEQYRCVIAGTSGTVEPAGKLLSITDGTVGWTYFPNPNWIAGHPYTVGMLINSDDQKIYKCSTTGTSNTVTTPWTANTVYALNDLRVNDTNKLYKVTKIVGDAKSAPTTMWATSTVYAVGDVRKNGPIGTSTDVYNTYVVVAVSGDAMSAASGRGPLGGQPIGDADPNIVDNHVTWHYKSSATGPKGTAQIKNVFTQILDNNVSWTFVSGAFGPIGTDEVPPIRDGTGSIVWDYLPTMPDSVGPTGTGTAINDGTCIWEYVSSGGGGPTTGPTGTADYIVDGGCAWDYINTVAATTLNGPTGTSNNIVDGTVIWAYQPSPLTTLATSTWCDVAWSGTEWYLEAKGSLA